MKKKWYKRKTTWAGAASFITGILLCFGGNVPIGAPMIINGAGFIFGREAIDGIMGKIEEVAQIADTIKAIKDK